MREPVVRTFLVAVSLAVSSCGRAQPSPRAVAATASSRAAEVPTEATVAPPGAGEWVGVDGVRVRRDEALFPRAAATIVPEHRLESPTDKPDLVAPAHARVELGARGGTFFDAEICVYPIEGFREAYAVAPDGFARVEADVRALRSVVENPSAARGEIPYVAGGVDGHETFHLRPRRVDFAGGKGVAFVTHYEIEPGAVTNAALTYVYEGLTDDGRYLVVATVPLSTGVLARSRDEAPSEIYDYPPDERAAYVARTVAALEALPPGGFAPDLDRLDAMMRSLEVTLARRARRARS